MSSQETEAIYFGIGEAERERLLSIRRQHETLKAALLEKKAAREVACVCCLETGDKWHMAKLPCEHMYCRECSSTAFEIAFNSRTPFKCCGQEIPAVCAHRFLSSDFQKKYTLLLRELKTPNPIYCFSPSCATWIPPVNFTRREGTCPECQSKTCKFCKKAAHKKECYWDEESHLAIKRMVRTEGWKNCPKCFMTVEKTWGCLHMKCRCRAEWCYSCLRLWTVYGSPCNCGDY